MVEKSLGRYNFLPNPHGVMAGSPVMYEAYQSIGAIAKRLKEGVFR